MTTQTDTRPVRPVRAGGTNHSAPAVPTAPLAAAPAADRVSFGRLLAYLARPLINSRGMRFMWAFIGLFTLGACALAFPIVNFAHKELGADFTFGWLQNQDFAAGPMMVLVPIALIMFLTGDWVARSVGSTFLVEPRRGRVVAAQALIVLAVTLVAAALGFGLTAALSSALGAAEGLPVVWTTTASDILWPVADWLLTCAFAFGLALFTRSTAFAMAGYLSIPILLQSASIMGELVTRYTSWLDIWSSEIALASGEGTSLIWAKLAVGVVVMIVIPTVVGVWRIRRATVA